MSSCTRPFNIPYSDQGPRGGIGSTECHQNQTQWRYSNADHSQQVSLKSIANFLSYVDYRQTDTDTDTNTQTT